MSQHDYDIANQLSSNLRIDLNNALKALNSNNSGATEPTGSESQANMLWYDTANNILKMKPEGNAAGQWISIGYLDQGTNTFKILDDTVVTTADGLTDAGLLGDQTTGTWETGTGTTESLVSPAKVKAAVIANVPDPIGVGQTWQDMSASRAVGTSYQNTTGRPIMVSVGTTISTEAYLQVSSNGTTWVSVGTLGGHGGINDSGSSQAIVPDDHYYKATGGTLAVWAELR
tara:strand:+ start:1378 stop:2067 length:690 start_codon:yes stop_codon:yes gene_type:complete